MACQPHLQNRYNVGALCKDFVITQSSRIVSGLKMRMTCRRMMLVISVLIRQLLGDLHSVV